MRWRRRVRCHIVVKATNEGKDDVQPTDREGGCRVGLWLRLQTDGKDDVRSKGGEEG